jgi:hypothetical protein
VLPAGSWEGSWGVTGAGLVRARVDAVI